MLNNVQSFYEYWHPAPFVEYTLFSPCAFFFFLASLSEIRRLCLYEAVPGSPLLCHGPRSLTSYLCHAVFSNTALWRSLKSALQVHPPVFFLLRITLTVLVLLCFHINLSPTPPHSVSVNKNPGIYSGMVWNMKIVFGKMAISTMLILPRPEHGGVFPPSSLFPGFFIHCLNVCIREFFKNCLF